MADRNPFIISGYHTPELFCDREKETNTLISNARNGVNTTLISIRRMGKTGLIWHAMDRLSEERARSPYMRIFMQLRISGISLTNWAVPF